MPITFYQRSIYHKSQILRKSCALLMVSEGPISPEIAVADLRCFVASLFGLRNPTSHQVAEVLGE
jgi:hypothetical protein